jgi:hypothetical protein
VQLPLDVLGDDEDLKLMFAWLAKLPAYQADFARTRQLVGDVEDLSRWLARVENAGGKALGAPSAQPFVTPKAA